MKNTGTSSLTRKETQDITRQAILDTAMSVIAEKGVSAVSIRGICKKSGFTQGAFYSNFTSKEDLLLQLMSDYISHEIIEIKEIILKTKDKSLVLALKDLAELLGTLANNTSWSFLSIELQLYACRSKEFSTKYNKLRSSYNKEFSFILKSLAERYNIEYFLPIKELAVSFYALWSGLAIQGDFNGILHREKIILAFFKQSIIE